jgi:hypothetical protein
MGPAAFIMNEREEDNLQSRCASESLKFCLGKRVVVANAAVKMVPRAQDCSHPAHSWAFSI